MPAAIAIVAIFCTLAAILHIAGILMVTLRGRRPGSPGSAPPDAPAVSVVRPVCGIENHIEATLASTFALSWPRYEILFCVAAERDPIVPGRRAPDRRPSRRSRPPARRRRPHQHQSEAEQPREGLGGGAARLDHHGRQQRADAGRLYRAALRPLDARHRPRLLAAGRRGARGPVVGARMRLPQHFSGALAARRRRGRARLRAGQDHALAARHPGGRRRHPRARRRGGGGCGRHQDRAQTRADSPARPAPLPAAARPPPPDGSVAPPAALGAAQARLLQAVLLPGGLCGRLLPARRRGLARRRRSDPAVRCAGAGGGLVRSGSAARPHARLAALLALAIPMGAARRHAAVPLDRSDVRQRLRLARQRNDRPPRAPTASFSWRRSKPAAAARQPAQTPPQQAHRTGGAVRARG